MHERWAFVFRDGSRLDDREPLFGENRAVVELARYVQQTLQADVSFLVDSDSDVLFGFPVVCGTRLEDQAAWIRQQKPAVVVGISTGRIFCHAQGRKNIVYHHNPTVVDGVGEFGRELYAQLQSLVVVSDNARRQQLDWGAPPGKVTVVKNGVDQAIYHPRSETRRQGMLVFAGTIIDYKGVDVVLAAFAEAQRTLPGLELQCFGDNRKYSVTSSAREGAEWMEQRGLLDADGKANWEIIEQVFPGVHYGGCVSAEKLAEVFSRASLLLIGSRMPETFGLVSIEAQACGCIPVVPDHGGLPETILRDKTGVTYPPGDATNLAARIVELCQPESADMLCEWSRQAIDYTRQTYSWRKTGEAFCREVDRIHAHHLGNHFFARLYRVRRLTKRGILSLFSKN